MAQNAYDLERFANRPLEDKPRMRAVQGKKQRLKLDAQKLRTIAVGVVMAGLAMGQIQSEATIAQLTNAIQKTNKQLVNAQSDYNYLASVMDSKTSLKNVEQIAISQLGLMKLDKSQITYVTLEEQAAIQRPESGLDQWISQLQDTWNGLFDYLAP